jgi:ArsR family transcriptional regulator
MNENKEIYKMHADFCKFMGSPKRIEIIFILGEGEKCVEELAQLMEISVSNVSQNLSIMREKKIVETRREGTKIFYSLSNPRILEACSIMRDLMIEQLGKKLKLFKEL